MPYGKKLRIKNIDSNIKGSFVLARKFFWNYIILRIVNKISSNCGLLEGYGLMIKNLDWLKISKFCGYIKTYKTKHTYVCIHA